MASGLVGFIVSAAVAAGTIFSPMNQAETQFTPIAPLPPSLSEVQSNTEESITVTDEDSVAFSELFGSGSGGSSRESVDDDSNISSKKHPTGIDISSHQHGGSGSIDIPQTVSGGQSFAFIKATEGTHYINPHFRSDTIDFIEKKVPVGFYHYARPSKSDGAKQAQMFVKVTGIDRGVKSFDPVLDIEVSEGMEASELIEWVRDFVDEVRALTGRETMIYTYPDFWKTQMNNTKEFSDLPLWIASYAPTLREEAIPGGWDDWDFWQYTSSGKIEGYSGKIDVNVFNGTEKELSKLYVGANVSDDTATLVRSSNNSSTGTLPSSSVFPEDNLKAGAVQLGRAIAQEFPEIKQIGGYRANDRFPDHPSGKALDIMIPNYKSSTAQRLGDKIVKYILDNQEHFGLNYMIWKQNSIHTDGSSKPMEDRGSDTENHVDHIHVLTNDGSEVTSSTKFRNPPSVSRPSKVSVLSNRDDKVVETIRIDEPRVTETVTVKPPKVTKTVRVPGPSSEKSSSRSSTPTTSASPSKIPFSEAFR